MKDKVENSVYENHVHNAHKGACLWRLFNGKIHKQYLLNQQECMVLSKYLKWLQVYAVLNITLGVIQKIILKKFYSVCEYETMTTKNIYVYEDDE